MRFASRLRPAAAPLLIAAGVSVATAGLAQAQDASPAEEASSNLGEITVTGTRGRPRSIASSPAPIDVLQPEVLETVGRSGLQEALNAVLPSYNLPGSCQPKRVAPLIVSDSVAAWPSPTTRFDGSTARLR